jgi:UDP-galactopyranose mutase
MDFNGLKYLVVGSGFFGSVFAERVASILGERVLVIDKRDHIGGNSFSRTDTETNIEVHQYGSHIFHTSNQKVIDYITRFASFNRYRHRVLTVHKDRVYPMPVNLLTINSFFGKNFTPDEARSLIERETMEAGISEPGNFEEKAISLIGRSLYEAFIKGYTRKQWEIDPKLLPSSIISRLPVRYNYIDGYFSDTFEGQPEMGYGQLFRNLLNHPKIEVRLGVDYFSIRDKVPSGCTVIYTGPIDQYFNFQLGSLQWRTVDLVEERLGVADFQGNSVINYADVEVPFTRIHEFKHYHPERVQSSSQTIIQREYSRRAIPGDVPYYPVNTTEDARLLKRYKELAAFEKNVIFGGRLGNYVYIDMHQAIAMALNGFEKHHNEITGR